MRKNKILSILLILFVFVLTSSAQPTLPSPHERNMPYKEGESLTYEAKYKKLGFAFSIAEFNFTVSRIPDTSNFSVKSEAHSKGTLTKLFNFEFYQLYYSTVDADKLQILKTTKRDEQGDRVRLSEAEFDYESKKVTYVETDPKDSTRPPRRVASTIDETTQDIVSGVYMLRIKDLAVGQKFFIKVSDSGLVYDVPVQITARERVKSILGKKWCWRIEPEIFGEGRFIEQKGSLTIWMSDDEYRIPLRAKLETKLGDVDIKLKKVEGRPIVLEDK